MRLGTSAVQRPGGLLDCLQPSVHIGKPKRSVPTSTRESAAAATRQMNLPAEVNTKQAKSEAFLLLHPFILVAIRRCQPHSGKVFPDLLRSSRPAPIDMPTDTPTDQLGLRNPSLRVSSWVNLDCTKLTFNLISVDI